MKHTEKPESGGPRIAVIGVGEDDISAVNHMIASGLRSVDCIAADVDSLILIPCGSLAQHAPGKAAFRNMPRMDGALYSTIKGISAPITVDGFIHFDLADMQAAMRIPGFAVVSEGRAKKKTRAHDAAMMALASPLFEGYPIGDARVVFLHITSSSDITIEEIAEAASIVQGKTHENARVHFGAAFDESLGDEIRITVLATGIGSGSFTTPADGGSPGNLAASGRGEFPLSQ